MLGLTPGLLATLGPTVGEISLLSSQVPILSFLLSMGATAIYPTRPFDYSEPTEILHKGSVMHSSWANSKWDIVLIVAEYLLAAAACANVWQNSYQLGRQTTFAPICNQSWWVVGWTAVPSLIHILAAIGYNAKIIRGSRKTREDDETERLQAQSENDQCTSFVDIPQQPTSAKRPYRLSAVRQSSGIWVQSIFDRSIVPLKVSEIPWWLKLVNSLCSVLSFIHVIFGIFIFSSLQFVFAGDAVGVLVRYLASALVCRVVMIIEFGRMRREWKEHPEMQEGLELRERERQGTGTKPHTRY